VDVDCGNHRLLLVRTRACAWTLGAPEDRFLAAGWQESTRQPDRAEPTSQNATPDRLAGQLQQIYSLVMASESGWLVLVVDDDADHLLMLEALLEAAGYGVVTAASCAEGRAVLMSRRIDALVAN